MKQQIVFTVIAKDKPGIVTTIADVINKNSGNWLDSRMSQLAGEFAGIIHIKIDSDKVDDIKLSLNKLSDKGIIINIKQSTSHISKSDYQLHQIEIFANDRPGIVAEVSKLFAEKNINIIELDTNITETSMSGGLLFHADAVIGINKHIKLDSLKNKLQYLADELSLDIEWTSKL